MPTVLAVMAHPDDIELTCAGTLVLLRRAGWKGHLASTIPNWKATFNGKPAKAVKKMPAILYADPIDNIDAQGRRVPARYVVDITSVLDMKEKMLAAHDSQRSWLREQHGEDEYLLWM